MLRIYFENEQDKIIVTDKLKNIIENAIEQTLEHEKILIDAEINVLFVDDQGIREINFQTRDIDEKTDVLSFPMIEFENGKMLDQSADYYEGFLILGDIVLSLERGAAQAAEYGHSFFREVGYLVCHSALHLLGYDHEKDADRKVMREKEEIVMEKLKLSRE